MSSHDAPLKAFTELIATAEPPLLGPQSRPGTEPVQALEDKLAGFFRDNRVAPTIQPLLRSAALLWHDHLDASHTISQGIETRDGSWLHGIMHRREPDYGNAKYWFQRVGRHDAFPQMARHVAAFLRHDELAGRLIENGEWQPYAFIDECEHAGSRGSEARRRTLREIQAIEFDVLLEHIFSAA